MPEEPPRFVTVNDYEPAARSVLERAVYDYYAGGAGDEKALARNLTAYDDWTIHPRVLRGVGTPDPSTTVFGVPLAFPVLVAPWAFQWMACRDGEQGTARGAALSGTVMVVSSTAVDQLEAIALASPAPKWWQLYVFTDRARTEAMLGRAVAAGYGAVVWTVDAPVLGTRDRDTRNGFTPPVGVSGDLVFDPALTWDDLAWIRRAAPGLPVLAKGIMTGADARVAVEHGIDGIVVSNHGGRQLDRMPSALEVLPEVVEAVAGRVPVLMDGGIRRGTDVLTALALGAAAVMVARPVAWGLAVAGADGVADVLRILREELVTAMKVCGTRTVADITADLVRPAASARPPRADWYAGPPEQPAGPGAASAP
jgi:isopentenyl diphosphate isomerase/L-lactate dehydrogenase-like FMN-dependent dehydrogenase